MERRPGVAIGSRSWYVVALDGGRVGALELNDSDEAEIAYWRGRALEKRDPSAAVREYLAAVKSDTAFAAFARTRLASMNLDRERALRDAQVRALVAAKKFDRRDRLAQSVGEKAQDRVIGLAALGCCRGSHQEFQ